MAKFKPLLIVVLLVLCVSCSSSSGEKTEAAVEGSADGDAFAYYKQIDGMLAEVTNKVSGFNAVLKSRDQNRIRSELRVVQDSLTRTADSASELGGFGEDTALNWALLDLLEFYESLYTENLPQMIEVGFAGDREQYRELNQAYQARLKGELPPLEQKYIQAEREFASKYGLTQTSGSSGGGDIRDKINRHLNFQSKHGSQRDKERAKRIQEQLKEMDQ